MVEFSDAVTDRDRARMLSRRERALAELAREWAARPLEPYYYAPMRYAFPLIIPNDRIYVITATIV